VLDHLVEINEPAVDKYNRPLPAKYPSGESHPVGHPEAAVFDPAVHTVDEVIAHLEGADDEERQRVLDAEADGKQRVTIAGWEPAQ
jgi:hypothetical protein